MKAKMIYDALDEIRAVVQAYADSGGNIEADEICVRVALEFCNEELKKAFEKGKCRQAVPSCEK